MIESTFEGQKPEMVAANRAGFTNEHSGERRRVRRCGRVQVAAFSASLYYLPTYLPDLDHDGICSCAHTDAAARRAAPWPPRSGIAHRHPYEWTKSRTSAECVVLDTLSWLFVLLALAALLRVTLRQESALS